MVIFYASAAISLVAAGVVIGVTSIVCLGIHHEERDRSVIGDANVSAIRGVRRLTGLYVRGYRHARESVHGSQES